MSTAADFDRMVADFMSDDPMTATYRKVTQGAYDPSMGEASSSVIVDTEVEAIMLELTLRTNGLSTAQNSLIQAGDKMLFVRPPQKTDTDADALVIDPSNDRVIVAGVEYKVVTFKDFNPSAANQVLIELYIRR